MNQVPSANWYMKGRINRYSVTRDGAKILDFIPVRKGTVGYLYDRVSGALFGNAGTGDFVLGPDVVPVEYIESHGTEWIDTGVIYNTTDRFEIFQDIRFIGGSQQKGSGWGAGGGVVYQDGHYDTGNSQMGTDPISIPERLNATIVVQGTSSQYSYTGGGKTKTATRSNSLTAYAASTGYPFGQITANHGAMYTGLSALLYGIKIYVNSDPIRSFRPVRVGTGSTWEGAMMDVLTRKVYRNQGTGAFTYGNDLRYPIPAEQPT